MKNEISIYIPAYNEEQNIQNMLRSLIRQKTKSLKIKGIYVVTDGCTDNTVARVIEMQHINKKIYLIKHNKRVGKVSRLNEIFRINKSPCLMIFDGDIVLNGDNVVQELFNTLKSDNNSLLVAAHQIPLKEKSFISKIIYAAYKVWDDTRLAVPEQKHIHNFYGAASAYRKEFSDSLKIPASITDERGFIYMKSSMMNGFRYAKNASIYYRPVHTIHDLRKLGDRSFNKNQLILSKFFGNQIFEIYYISSKYKLRSILVNFVKSPFYTTLGVLLNFYLRLFPLHDELYDKGMWESSRSTKKAINI